MCSILVVYYLSSILSEIFLWHVKCCFHNFLCLFALRLTYFFWIIYYWPNETLPNYYSCSYWKLMKNSWDQSCSFKKLFWTSFAWCIRINLLSNMTYMYLYSSTTGISFIVSLFYFWFLFENTCKIPIFWC